MGKFINEECLAEMKKMPDDSIDFIFTSPPYADQIKDYGMKEEKIKPSKFDEWFSLRAEEMYRILKPTGSLVLNINDKLDGKFQSTFVFKLVILLTDQIGFHLVRDYIWYNPATPPNVFSRGTMGRTKKSHEYCFWFSKSETWTFNMDAIRKPYSGRMKELFKAGPQGDRDANTRPSRHNFDLSHQWKDKGGADPGSVITLSNTSSNDTFHRLCSQFGISHPARFPIKLAEFFIKAGTNEGDIVLDPFGGSGTAAIAAQALNRDFVYIEINPDYCDMAQKWWNVEFNCDELYRSNLEKYFNEIIPKCRWSLIPLAFLYDLYQAWFPTIELYEKPQTRTVFYERIKKYLENNRDWKLTDGLVTVSEENMPLPEPLIQAYHLKNWMNKDYTGDDTDILCSPVLKSQYKGIVWRHGRETNTTRTTQTFS